MIHVGVVDSGICNLGSITTSLERLGAEVRHLRAPDDFQNLDRVILPGVGSYASGMAALREHDLITAIQDFSASGKPLLGICLGMQLLFDSSQEFGATDGLGIIAGRVTRIESDTLPVPHMGWNRIDARADALPFVESGRWFYFVHSYVCTPIDPAHVAGETDYSGAFCSVVKRDNVVGIQAHPEKSQHAGADFLKGFLNA